MSWPFTDFHLSPVTLTPIHPFLQWFCELTDRARQNRIVIEPLSRMEMEEFAK